jgi:flavodoxin
MPSSRLSRREALRRSILLPVTAGSIVSAGPSVAGPRPSNTKVLVAYFSRTGNTRVIAGQVRRALDADLFEIQPAEAYPDEYEATVRRAQRERDAGHEPPLKAALPDIASHEAVFLGFPVWGMTTPPVIRSFLSGHDLSGKTLVPFVTHGGYGLGNSLAVVAEHAPQARLLEGFAMRADQERETLAQVTRWLDDVEMVTGRRG